MTRLEQRKAGFVVDGEHVPGCWAAKHNVVLVANPARLQRDWLGRKGSTRTTFIRFVCNNPDCSAAVLVRDSTLERFVTEAIA